MFTICILAYASLFATHPVSTVCGENKTKEQVLETAKLCDTVSKDPLTTCEMVRLNQSKFLVYIRKLDGV